MKYLQKNNYPVLADYLTRNGIAVLRCDDRGVGRSKGNFYKSTPLDLAGDLVAGYDFLASRKEIKSNETGLIGHSEGGVVASIAAGQREAVKFVVMLGAPGISLRKAFEAQTELQYKKGEISKERYDFCLGQDFLYFYWKALTMIDYKQIITIEPGKRGGKPCIRGMRITVSDILGWLASGMTIQDILTDFDELVEDDIYAALSYAADRENKIYQIAV